MQLPEFEVKINANALFLQISHQKITGCTALAQG
jgi:hypothetical protein